MNSVTTIQEISHLNWENAVKGVTVESLIWAVLSLNFLSKFINRIRLNITRNFLHVLSLLIEIKTFIELFFEYIKNLCSLLS